MLAAIAIAACRPPSEPPPTLYEDLGTEERPLLPTASVWHDTSVAKGTADWHPFRKPDPEAKPPPSPANPPTGGAPANDELAGELREVINEFNAVVAEGKNDEVADFLIEEQAAPAKQIIEVLPRFAAKLAELAAILPGNNDNLKKVATALTLAKILKLDVTAIESKGASEAVGKTPDGAHEVRFVLAKEDGEEFWYIDHPQIRAMGPSLSALEQSIPQLDGVIAGIKSGQISEEMAKQQAAAMDQMLGSLIPPAADANAEQAAPTGEPAGDDGSNDKNGDEG